jgi:peptide/nickel transport system substrate-binding protein
VQEILREELPVLPIFHYNFIEGTKKGFLNYKMSAFTVTNEWNTNEWGWSE